MAVKPLPSFLIHRYNDWKSNSYSQNKNWYKKISEEDQRPKAMVISCCDSRVHVTAIFGAEQGEFFIHRNIANLIPPFSPNGDFINDTYGLGGLTQGVEKLRMTIYNRWGEQVFYTEDVNKKWDGNYNGSPAQQGVYVYMIQFTNPKQTRWYYYNGVINLLR